MILIHFSPTALDVSHPNYIHIRYFRADGMILSLSELEAILILNKKKPLKSIKAAAANGEVVQMLAAQFREKYNLKGLTTKFTEIFRDKTEMKSRLSNIVPVPKSIIWDRKKHDYEFLSGFLDSENFILKEATGVGGIKAYEITNSQTYAKVAKELDSINSEFIAETFIHGDLYHCDYVMQNGEVMFYAAGKYNRPLLKYRKGVNLYSLPLGEDDLMRKRLKAFSMKALRGLGIFDTSYHMEVFYDKKKDRFYFLECAARLPGDPIIQNYNHCYNLNLYDLGLHLQMHEKINPLTPKLHKPSVILGCPKIPGIIKGYQYRKDMPCEIVPLIKLKEGTKVDEPKFFADVSFAALISSHSYATLLTALDEIENFPFVIYEPSN